MRILHALHDYLPEQVAGIEVYTNRVAHDQARRHEVGILFAALSTGEETGALEASSEDRVRLFAVTQHRRWRRFEQTWRDPQIEDGIERAIDAFSPDVIHVQHLLNLGLALPEIARRRGIPLVMTLHDHWLSCAAGGQRFHADRTRCDELSADRCGSCVTPQVGPALALRGAIQRRRAERGASDSGSPADDSVDALDESRRVGSRAQVLRRAWSAIARATGRRGVEARWDALRAFVGDGTLFIAPSLDMRAAALSFGVAGDRCLHVPHGLTLGREPGTPPGRLARRFGYVGSIVPHKGVLELVRAFESLPEEARLDVWGSLGDAPDYVREVRAAARHPGIRLQGEASPSRVPDLMAEMDALVVPSLWRENAPLSILEAFSLGRPVVASRIGGHPELCASLSPLLFDPGHVEGLASVLTRLATEPEFARDMALRVPRVPSVVEHTQALDSVYERVVASGDEVSAAQIA